LEIKVENRDVEKAIRLLKRKIQKEGLLKELKKDVEKAIRLLKRKIQKEGLLKELKKRRYYEKPSVRRKKKQIEAQKRASKSRKRRF
jgi:small subunit ribosomal protein S21